MFYATSDAYAIAALVFVRMLRRLGIRNDASLVVLHLPLSRQIVAKMRDMGIFTALVPELRHVKNRYYRHCLVKLRIFQLHEFERVVFADADAMPLKSLDSLFTIPFEGPIAAPAAYWLRQPFWTSALLVVRPSEAEWQRVSQHFASASDKGFYDMDIINSEFGSEIHTLPAGVFCLNSEWEEIDRAGFFGDFDETYSRVSVVHFTALGKPWVYSLKQVRRLRPKAHPIFYELWETWRKMRDEIL
ncbi:MAG: hypothetical protein ABSB35_33425 [Bryobacteraceae bacterium]